LKTYKFSPAGYFTGFGDVQECPRRPGIYLYDDRCETLIAPSLPVTAGKRAKFENGEWSEVDIDQGEIDLLKKNAIIKRLAELDLAEVRSLGAITAGLGTEFDTAKLIEIENEKILLRAELAKLGI
jgi:hypothetical protein